MHKARGVLLAAALVVAACAAHAPDSQNRWTPTPQSPPPIPASAPIAPKQKLYPQPAEHGRFCKGEVQSTFYGRRYFGCGNKLIVVDQASNESIKSVQLRVEGINVIEPAGRTVVSVLGWNDGAAIRNTLMFLRAYSLQMLTDPTDDNTFLGVVGNRIYVNDWCCFGRGDEYRPATIYSISPASGEASEKIDLRPDDGAWEGVPHGVGEFGRNYLVGHYLYVPVRDITYRYDITDLHKPFVRMRTPKS